MKLKDITELCVNAGKPITMVLILKGYDDKFKHLRKTIDLVKAIRLKECEIESYYFEIEGSEIVCEVKLKE